MVFARGGGVEEGGLLLDAGDEGLIELPEGEGGAGEGEEGGGFS